jgi:hypothetical protein
LIAQCPGKKASQGSEGKKVKKRGTLAPGRLYFFSFRFGNAGGGAPRAKYQKGF